MKKSTIYRGFFYIMGLIILAFGLVLNSKAGMGVSAIISVSYCASEILNKNFGDVTFVWYAIFIMVEIFIHFLMSRRSEGSKYRVNDLKKAVLMDLLQFPMCLLFTRFMNLFSNALPMLEDAYKGSFLGTFTGRFLALLFAIICTGIGAIMSLDMRIIPNPGDGIVQAISDFVGRNVGFVKNCFDCFSICLTLVISFLVTGHIVGVGIGTVMAVIGVGRVMAFFNHFCYGKVGTLAGLE